MAEQMLKVELKRHSLERADGMMFKSDNALFSFLVSRVNGQAFEKRYTKECMREKNGTVEVYNKTLIPKADKKAMLLNIQKYLEINKHSEGYYVQGITKLA